MAPFLRCCLALSLTALVLAPLPARANDQPPPSRVVIFLSSSDRIIADLEHLVVNLAGQQEQWDNNVFPNIDIFLIGVDGKRPIFFDQIMDAEHGQRPQVAIPVSDLNEFILDNLDPLGIIVAPVRRRKDYYELEEVYEGWMRIVDNYAAFGEHESDVPETIPSPQQANQELLSRGYLAGIQLNNALTAPEQRLSAFATFRENTMAAVNKRPQETNDQFALRRTNRAQNLEILERVFVEASEITVGLVVDTTEDQGRGEFLLTAVPDSRLAATISMQAQDHSYFASLPSPDDATLSGRIHFTLDELLQNQADELYPLMRPVVMQRIDDEEAYTPAQKEARKEVAGILLDMLEAGGEVGKLDTAIEMQPAAGGVHNVVAGIRVADGAPVERVLELLPAGGDQFAIQLNVDQSGDVSIHKLTFAGDYPRPLANFFGDAPDFYVGAAPDAVWISGGPDGLELLKSSIEAVAATPDGDADPTVARLDMRFLPILRLIRELRDDGTFDLQDLLSNFGGASDNGDDADEESTTSMLRDCPWGAAALEALAGEDDRLHLEIHREEDRLEGTGRAERGILKAIGELIAKFAKDNLG